jgi:hypothetical protein
MSSPLIPGHQAGLVGGPADLADRALGRGIGGDLTGEHRAMAEDDREQIVEVVRDASGQTTNGLHLLRLADLFLEPLLRLLGSSPLRDVLVEAEGSGKLTAHGQRHAVELDLDQAPVFPAPLRREVDRLAGENAPRQLAGLFHVVLGGDERVEVLADHFGLGVEEERHEGPVAQGDAAPRIQNDDRQGVLVWIKEPSKAVFQASVRSEGVGLAPGQRAALTPKLPLPGEGLCVLDMENAHCRI